VEFHLTSISKPNLRGLASIAVQYDLYVAMRWLDKFKNDIAVLNADSIGLNTSRPALTIKLMI
jgi:hypothetical protein